MRFNVPHKYVKAKKKGGFETRPFLVIIRFLYYFAVFGVL